MSEAEPSRRDSQNRPGAPIIPARLVVGVTGHRTLSDEPMLAALVREVLDSIETAVGRPDLPVVFTVLSPLAEGADRLVVREVLRREGSQLQVVLPLEKDDYLQDFETSESKAEFEALLAEARHVRELKTEGVRVDAYAAVGRYIVEHCDVLIALWNGEPAAGKGGTAEIVAYARDTDCPLYWINTQTLQLAEQPAAEVLESERFTALSRYNAEPVQRAFEAQVDTQQRRLDDLADKAGYLSERLREIAARLFPHYAKADGLALKFQARYMRAGTLVYACTAGAVAVVAFQSLFLPEHPRVVLLEVAFMIVVLGVWWFGNRRKWHSKWIDYRFLAERFRSALFMAAAGIEVAAPRPPKPLIPTHASTDWMVAAFFSVWNLLPDGRSTEESEFAGLKTFLLSAWIDDQIAFHESRRHRHAARHSRLTKIGLILFGLTFVAALIHSANVGPHWLHSPLAFAAVVFPACGAAAAGMRSHREYLRNAKRSEAMVRYLSDLKRRMEDASDLGAFLPLVQESEELMRYENEDWRVLVQFQPIELPS